jgi:hypothetical protein
MEKFHVDLFLILWPFGGDRRSTCLDLRRIERALMGG